MAAYQGAEEERVTWAVPGLLRLWKSVEKSKTGTAHPAGPRKTKLEIRNSEPRAGMTEKGDPPFLKANIERVGHPAPRKEKTNSKSFRRVLSVPPADGCARR